MIFQKNSIEISGQGKLVEKTPLFFLKEAAELVSAASSFDRNEKGEATSLPLDSSIDELPYILSLCFLFTFINVVIASE